MKKPSESKEGFFHLFNSYSNFGLRSQDLVACGSSLEGQGMLPFWQFDLYGVLMGRFTKLSVDEKMDMIAFWSLVKNVMDHDGIMNGRSTFGRSDLD